jgi:hypothetical protein
LRKAGEASQSVPSALVEEDYGEGEVVKSMKIGNMLCAFSIRRVSGFDLVHQSIY